MRSRLEGRTALLVLAAAASINISDPAQGESRPVVYAVARPVLRQDIAPAQSDHAKSHTDLNSELYLEVFINEASTKLIAAFVRRADGSFAIAPKELEELGLLPAAEAIGADGLVALDRLPGVTSRYDEAGQTIYFTARDAARETHVVDVTGAARSGSGPAARADWGGVLNYTMYAASGGHEFSDLAHFESPSAGLDMRVFGPLGTLDSSALANPASDDSYALMRLDTAWSWSDPERLLTYKAGDLISGGFSWTRPVRLGGIQIQRSFRLRPDLVTLPLPKYSGSAAVPSTLDIFSGGGLVYSGALPAGPFVTDNLPVVTGPGQARFVVTDALGRETVAEQAFYVAPGMLQPGMFDFSVEAGLPRRSYGTESFGYDDAWAASGSVRRGFNVFTLEGHAEVAEALLNGGIGGVIPIGAIGAGSASISGSQSDDGQGLQASASAEFRFGDISVFARLQRTFGEYRDIAAISSEGDYFDSLPLKGLEQISLSFPLNFDAGTFSLGATHLERGDGEESLLGNLSYSRPMPRGSTLFVSAFADFADEFDMGGYVGFSIPLGAKASGSVGADHRGSATVNISRSETPEPGSVGWRVRSGVGEDADHGAGLSYRTRFGRVAAEIGRASSHNRATAQIDGAIVLAGGSVFATNRIDDAFAVVDAGAPGVDVLYENRPAGKTGANGRLIIPVLRSYEANKITIDPESLPLDAVIEQTEEIVVPADRSGVAVGFVVATETASAVVEFQDEAGVAIAAGATGQLEGKSAPFFIGYDGEGYVTGLSRHNVATVVRADGSSCVAAFGFEPQQGGQSRIADVSCR